MLPLMTRQEHGDVSKLASILLLGFLLPHSTGNEFFLLQSLSKSKSRSSFQHQTAGSQTSESTTSENIQEYILNMTLEERLECTSHRCNPNEFGEFNSLVHEPVDFLFHSFLTRALGPFLSGRPAHTEVVDLIHILAMAIHPQPSDQPIGQTADQLEQLESHEWTATKVLMSSAVPHSFHVNYNHRLAMVRLVSDCLRLPEYNKINSANDAPLFQGALPHLRASLYAFGMAAMNPFDSNWAQCGLVSAAVQTGIDYVVKEEWGRLLHRLVDDQTNYKCSCSIYKGRKKNFSLMTQDPTSFCPHRARGELLEQFMTRFNESRHYSDAIFLQHSLGSLTDAIEWQVDCWTKSSEENEDEDEEGDGTTDDPPCMLASLLLAAKQVFYFLLPIVNVDDKSGEESEENHRRDMLVSCGIQLLHHWDPKIASEASALLVLAFCYGPDDMVKDYASAVFQSTRLALENHLKDVQPADADSHPKRNVFPIQQIISTFSHKSESYADSMFNLLLSAEQIKSEEDIKNNSIAAETVCRLIAFVASACPVSGERHLEQLVKMVERSDLPENCAIQIMSAILSARRSQFFLSPNESLDNCFKRFSSEDPKHCWERFLLARHAMTTGSFDMAKLLFAQIDSCSSSESSFIWISALKKVADAELSLATDAAQGIPSATILLRSAKYSITSLSSMSRSNSTSFEFQSKVLDLRLNFLDIAAIIRQLTREMRLTGVGPKKNTRPNLHLRNAVKCLDVLATKYLSVYRQHGLFMCQQSRTVLRTLHALSRFLASATRNTFLDEIPQASSVDMQMNAIKALTLPKGDAQHPLTILMGRLDSAVLQHLDTSVDGKIRAAALLEILDGVLKCPAPFPRDFVQTSSVKPALLRLSVDPDSVDSLDGESDFDEEIEVSPGASFSYFASGKLPVSLLDSAKLPFSVVLLWHQISFRGDAGEDANPDDKSDDKRADPLDGANPAPSASAVSSTGAFFSAIQCGPLQTEGRYVVTTWLGCRDVRGGEWELPLMQGSHSIRIRVK
jgi:hypothetical protein